MFKDTAEIIVAKWLDEVKVDRNDKSLHFVFHLCSPQG